MKITVELTEDEVFNLLAQYMNTKEFTLVKAEPKLKQEYIRDDNDIVQYYGFILEVEKQRL